MLAPGRLLPVPEDIDAPKRELAEVDEGDGDEDGDEGQEKKKARTTFREGLQALRTQISQEKGRKQAIIDQMSRLEADLIAQGRPLVGSPEYNYWETLKKTQEDKIRSLIQQERDLIPLAQQEALLGKFQNLYGVQSEEAFASYKQNLESSLAEEEAYKKTLNTSTAIRNLDWKVRQIEVHEYEHAVRDEARGKIAKKNPEKTWEEWNQMLAEDESRKFLLKKTIATLEAVLDHKEKEGGADSATPNKQAQKEADAVELPELKARAQQLLDKYRPQFEAIKLAEQKAEAEKKAVKDAQKAARDAEREAKRAEKEAIEAARQVRMEEKRQLREEEKLAEQEAKAQKQREREQSRAQRAEEKLAEQEAKAQKRLEKKDQREEEKQRAQDAKDRAAFARLFTGAVDYDLDFGAEMARLKQARARAVAKWPKSLKSLQWTIVQAEEDRSTAAARSTLLKRARSSKPPKFVDWKSWQTFLASAEAQDAVLKMTLAEVNKVVSKLTNTEEVRDPDGDGEDDADGSADGSDEEDDSDDEGSDSDDEDKSEEGGEESEPMVVDQGARTAEALLARAEDVSFQLQVLRNAARAEVEVRKQTRSKWEDALAQEDVNAAREFALREPPLGDARAHLIWQIEGTAFKAEEAQRLSLSRDQRAEWNTIGEDEVTLRDKDKYVKQRRKTQARSLEALYRGLPKDIGSELAALVENALLEVRFPIFEEAPVPVGWAGLSKDHWSLYELARMRYDRLRYLASENLEEANLAFFDAHRAWAVWEARKLLDVEMAFDDWEKSIQAKERFDVAYQEKELIKAHKVSLTTRVESMRGKIADAGENISKREKAQAALEAVERVYERIAQLDGERSAELDATMEAEREVAEKWEKEKADLKIKKEMAAAQEKEENRRNNQKKKLKEARLKFKEKIEGIQLARRLRASELQKELEKSAAGASARKAAQAVAQEEYRQSLQKRYDEDVLNDAKLPASERSMPYEHGDGDPDQLRRGGAPHYKRYDAFAVVLSPEQHEYLFRSPEDLGYGLGEEPVAPVSVSAPGTVAVGAMGASPSSSSASAVAKASDFYEPLLFNRSYALRLLAEHFKGLRAAHAKAVEANEGAKYTNPAESLGENPEEKILDFFFTMLRYRQTVLAAKRLLVEERMQFYASADDANALNDLKTLNAEVMRAEQKERVARRVVYANANTSVDEIDEFLEETDIIQNAVAAVAEARAAYEAKRKTLSKQYQDLVQVANELDRVRDTRPQWTTEAERMLSAERGQLPGQLFAPQPQFLPLRIAAPPRLGKSATAFLVVSLARRIGMVCTFSVSPNKTIPMEEFKGKLKKLQWSLELNAKEEKLPGAQQTLLPLSAFDIDRDPMVPDLKQRTLGSPCKGSLGRGDVVALPDVIFYSSDQALDCQRVAAYLGFFSEQPVAVLHVRDEAQSLAKQLENPVEDVKCHSVAVPAPTELHYLRSYYGNMFGLNLNVTATHFPTFLEEELWGFLGSTKQNARIPGLSIAAHPKDITARPGSKYLPALVPALLPARPAGYFGVETLEAWRGESIDAGPSLKAEVLGGTVALEDLNLKQLKTSKVIAASFGGGSTAAQQRKKAAEDEISRILKKIDDQFVEWLELDEEEDFAQAFGGMSAEPTKISSMFIAALNTAMKDVHMASFVRQFAKLAWEQPKPKPVVFIFFNSVIKSRQDMVDSNFNVPDEEVKTLFEGKEATCFLFDPKFGDNKKNRRYRDPQPILQPFLAASSEEAIEHARSNDVKKACVLGFGMFRAGLTLQHVVVKKGAPRVVYAPRYIALASSTDAPLDDLLQKVGRCFVDIKEVDGATNWSIKLLARDGLVERLQGYAALEARLASTGGVPVYKALKGEFDRTELANSTRDGSAGLGLVGARRGDILAILGLTRMEAARLQRGKKKKEAAPEEREIVEE